MDNNLISPLQRLAMMEGERKHMIFKPVTLENYRRDWVYEQVNSIPTQAKRPLEILQRANFEIKAVYVAHEAPKNLPAPKEEPKAEVRQDIEIGPIVSGLAQVAMVLTGLVGILFYVLFQLVLLDPAVIVELSDGSLLEVTNWRQK